MTYDGALVMPKSYAVMTEDEMTYVEGGAELSLWQKGVIIGVCLLSTAALTVALVYGQLAIAAKIFGMTVRGIVREVGAKAVVALIAATLPVSAGFVWASVNFLIS